MTTDSSLPLPEGPPSGPNRLRGAYLVLRSAGRWSDVFRICAPGKTAPSDRLVGQAVIGRSSANQIALRSDQASRRHARVYWNAGDQGDAEASRADAGWFVEDLASRNGTLVNGVVIDRPTRLVDGDTITIAGFSIAFSHQLDLGNHAASDSADSAAQATDDQLTMEIDPSAIADRRRNSSFLHSTSNEITSTDAGAPVSVRLLRLAFALARDGDVTAANETVLDTISQTIPLDTAAIYLERDGAKSSGSMSSGSMSSGSKSSGSKSSGSMPLVATRQTGDRSYRPPPESLILAVCDPSGQATLVRNVAGDGQVATENSRGVIEVDSLILAPIRSHDGTLRGMIHVTTAPDASALASDDLEFVVAACEIFAESLANMSDRQTLSKSLHRSRRQIELLRKQLGDKVRIIGRSEAIGSVIEKVGLAAPTDATVLVRGESGVGKELVAAAIHHASRRKDGPLVCLNCAALSPTLLESELFGHEKGAFTGATDRKRGKFEMADGGTLMLDEIGEMSAEVQAKFLRVLEGHPFERVGGHQPIRVDVRVVAATNRDLQVMVRDGNFRQDLYYRLHVIEIVVPPLRSRGKDVLLLANYFIERFNAEMGRKVEGLSDAAKKRLLGYSWPGNIRELKNVIERAVVLGSRPMIEDTDLLLSPAAAKDSEGEASGEQGVSPETTLAELEETHIRRVLRHTEGNKSRAASILGIERSTLDRKLKRYDT